MAFDIVGYLEKLYGIMPEPRALKVKTLYTLAYNHREGALVELGTFHGLGTAALCLGLRASGRLEDFSVYTVDPFTDCRGWIGEHYTPGNKNVFIARCKALDINPTLIQTTAVEASEQWKDGGVGLLFWDTGVLNQMDKDIAAWDKHVLPHGILYIRDTTERVLGSRQVIRNLSETYTVIVNAGTEIILEKK